MNLLADKQLSIKVPFQATKYRKKGVRTSKYKRLLEMCICPTCRNEKCVYFSTQKASKFYVCKKCKACSHVLNTPFKDQKPTIKLFGGDGTHCIARKTSRDYERETISVYEEIPPPITIKHTRIWAKKSKNRPIYSIILSTPHWLIQLTKNSFPFSFDTLSVYSKAT